MTNFGFTYYDDLLQDKYLAVRHSEIELGNGDIDYYIGLDKVSCVVDFLLENGFVLTDIVNSREHLVFRKFIEGHLYIVDICSSLNTMLSPLKFIFISDLLSDIIGSDVDLYNTINSLLKSELPKKQKETEITRFFSFVCEKNAISFNVHVKMEGYRFKNYIANLLRRSRRYVFNINRGVSIAFVGPDGSGKSYFIAKLGGVGRSSNLYMGDWFFFFQRLYNFIKLTIPTPYNRFVYLFYPIEQVLRRLKVAVQRFRGRVVLIDRWPGLNKNINKTGFLGFLNKINFYLYPKPDFIIHLYAPGYIVNNRKRELSASEIDKQNAALASFLAGVAVQVDTTDLDHTLNSILSLIYNVRRI